MKLRKLYLITKSFNMGDLNGLVDNTSTFIFRVEKLPLNIRENNTTVP